MTCLIQTMGGEGILALSPARTLPAEKHYLCLTYLAIALLIDHIVKAVMTVTYIPINKCTTIPNLTR